MATSRVPHPRRRRLTMLLAEKLRRAGYDVFHPCADCHRTTGEIPSVRRCNVCGAPLCSYCWPVHVGMRFRSDNYCHERETSRAVAAGERTREEILAEFSEDEC